MRAQARREEAAERAPNSVVAADESAVTGEPGQGAFDHPPHTTDDQPHQPSRHTRHAPRLPATERRSTPTGSARLRCSGAGRAAGCRSAGRLLDLVNLKPGIQRGTERRLRSRVALLVDLGLKPAQDPACLPDVDGRCSQVVVLAGQRVHARVDPDLVGRAAAADVAPRSRR